MIRRSAIFRWRLRATEHLEMASQLLIRAATRDDAGAISDLAQQFADYLHGLGDPTEFGLNAETYLRDGFGADPAFSGLVAESDGRVVGYLLYHFGYDSDHAARILHICDLYVQENARRRGAGRALMHAAANLCREAGGQTLFWAVYHHNKLAMDFYEKLGAQYVNGLKFMYWMV
jgi:ribosomal protein S18 acetylase RimI-like enzyme